MTGDLLSTLAHDLRNYIAPVVNAAHLIRLKSRNDPEMSGIVSIIERQVAAMTHTLDAVMDADRLAQGKVPLQMESVDLPAVVQSAVQARKSAFDSRRQTVRISCGPGPVRIDGDRARLAQAVGNLLDNAARYGDEGGEIAIDVATMDGEARLRIVDHGHGIEPDVLPHVFEAFTLRSPQRKGLGLGLTTARSICELHGGGISARSDGPGRGSEFVISLPLAPESAARARPSEAPADNSSAQPRASCPRRILVADDNQAVRNSFAAILKEMGHDVRLAADGMQAVELAEAWSPEFVIVDVHMPKIDGYAVARKLRARFPPAKMQLVMMSGTDLDPTTLMGAKQAGFDHCVDKTLAVKGIESLLRGEAPPVHA
jgi:CheY-like chemotaxis protein